MVPFEYLLVMPGDVHDVHRRLVRARGQERFVRHPHLADACLAEPGQPGQQFVASHQSRLPRVGAFRAEHGESGPEAGIVARSA